MGKRVIWIILDSAGAGEMPDATQFGDAGADTIGHIIKACLDIKLPNLDRLGLRAIDGTSFHDEAGNTPIGCFGRAAELSKGKDTTTGHWEMVGIHTGHPFPTYPNGFPQALIDEFIAKTGCRDVYGNKVASGIPIIKEYIDRHLETGYPIVYTSADSVFQIAASEEKVGLERLYEMCAIAREMLQGVHGVGRVIARPFVGTKENFKRTPNRRDYALNPNPDNVLVHLKDRGITVAAVGKIRDIFNGVGITRDIHTDNNDDGMAKTKKLMQEVREGLIFTNLVDFDMVYGHRRDVLGYREALETFDTWLGGILPELDEDDMLVINADHGCDPSYKGSDHTREYVPVFVYGKKLAQNVNLGTRGCFADIGQTIQEFLLGKTCNDTVNKESNAVGESFLERIRG